MRRRDWQERFAAYVRQHAQTGFEWGSHDCCTFAAGAVEALTGTNPMAAVPRYEDELAAARMVHRAGGLRALATEYLGEPVSPALANVGDVVLIENAGRELLGICNGTSALAQGTEAMVALEMTAARAAWKI